MYKPSTVVITRLTMYLIVKVNECVDRKGKIMDTRHKLPAIMCVLTYLNSLLILIEVRMSLLP